MEVYQWEESEEEVKSAGRCGIFKKSRDVAGREAPGMRAAKSFESRKGE